MGAMRLLGTITPDRPLIVVAVREEAAHLGERLILPPAFEQLRAQIEPALTPLPDPRPWARTA